MALPDHVKSFIFDHLESVEALEILLRLRREPARAWSATALAAELRLNENSVACRLDVLARTGLVRRLGEQWTYGLVGDREDRLVAELDHYYATHRHRVLETIFSPIRKANEFVRASGCGRTAQRTATMIIEGIIFFCAVTSLACAVLLARAYRRRRTGLLWTSSLAFGLLALNSLYLFVDVILLPDTDLNGVLWRSLLHAGAAVVLLGGLILEFA